MSVPDALSSNASTTNMQGAVDLVAMVEEDLVAIQKIECEVYQHPWSMKNFQDSLISGYDTRVLRDGNKDVVGYFVLMLALDEAHLLNITVRASLQGRGLGGILFDELVQIARAKAATTLLLEVRPSNFVGLAVYKHFGFKQIGIRKGYYPSFNQQREDAIVMQLAL